MKLPNSELSKRWTKGSGPGGQNRNKLETCCILTHTPTGLEAVGDERTRRESYKTAYAGLCRKVAAETEAKRALARKQRRDVAIKDTTRVRTYDFSRGVVTDHRTSKSATLKDILEKGRLDKLR